MKPSIIENTSLLSIYFTPKHPILGYHRHNPVKKLAVPALREDQKALHESLYESRLQRYSMFQASMALVSELPDATSTCYMETHLREKAASRKKATKGREKNDGLDVGPKF